MSHVRKIVCSSEINAPAEKYYNFFKKAINQLPDICPALLQKLEVHEGDWDTHGHGSVKIWSYTVDGKAEVFKEQVEFDDENLAVILIGLEGDVFKLYKSVKVIYQVVPKGPDHCLAVNTIEYEKHDDGCACPYKYLDIMNKITKDVESHLKK